MQAATTKKLGLKSKHMEHISATRDAPRLSNASATASEMHDHRGRVHLPPSVLWVPSNVSTGGVLVCTPAKAVRAHSGSAITAMLA